MGARPVVVDTDPGTDDAIAIAMALAPSELSVLGLTTVAGNVPLRDATRNALAILEALGRSDIGVWEGSEGPPGGVPQYAHHFHGPTGLTVDLGTPRSAPRPGTAVEMITGSARAHAGELELIAIGPLTNVSDALDSEPALPRLLRRIWVMGGAAGCPGNVTPHAEFNFYSDPAAATRVLGCGAPVTMIGLDVCDRVQVGPDGADPGLGDSLAGRLLTEWLRTHPGERFSMCDPLAVAAAVDPSIIGLRDGEVHVQTSGERRGESGVRYGTGPVQVAVQVDSRRALESIGTLAGGRARAS